MPSLRRARAGRALRALQVLPVAALLFAALAVIAQENEPPLSAEMDRLARRLRPSVVAVIAQRESEEPAPGGPGGGIRLEKRWITRVGSGVAVDAEGTVLTTASVVVGAQRLALRGAEGAQLDAELVGLDLVSNVALVRSRAMRTSPVGLAASGSPGVGGRVLVLGSSYRAHPTQSEGTVSLIFPDPRQSLLQITNPVYPGNSGAPAFNAAGELVGIVQGELGATAAGTDPRGAERRPRSAGLMLPVESLAPVVAQLRANGKVQHAFVGLRTRALSIESESERGTRVPLGALVESVVAGGPAAKAGLKPGDLVVAFEGERVEYPGQLARWVASSRPGSMVELVWVRDETRQSARITLAKASAQYPEWSAPAAAPAPIAGKIQQLEREILRLSRELEQLKSQSQDRR